jgi:beta-glucanase (GH16 family)
MPFGRFLLFTMSLILAIPATGADEWELVWADEFNYQGLPDSTKWTCEEGFLRNGESQYYTRDRAENARVENGALVIECRKEQFKPEKRDAVGYTAASLITRNKASWQYGRIEVRAKLPHGRGVWPAIWTLGTSITQIGWPRCGEIDIMEFVGKEPDKIHGTVHYGDEQGKHKSNGGKLKAEKPYEDFHVYAIEWFPDRIDFFFDKTKYHTFAVDQAGAGVDNPFRRPHYLLINFALGGTWGGPIDDTILPQRYLIDYVRVYNQKGGSQATR